MGRKVNHRFDTERAMELYKQGYSDVVIAERMGLVRQTILRWRKNEGLPTKRGVLRSRLERSQQEVMELYERGFSDREIGDKVGVMSQMIGHWRRVKGLPSNGRGRVSK